MIARRLTPIEAMDLWEHSDEASAFTRPDHLTRLVDEVEWWGVDRSGEIVAAWPLVRAVAGGEVRPPPFCYYVGPMFARSLRRGKQHRSWLLISRTFRALIEAVVETHPCFRFSLPPGLTDVRALEWWNFDHPDRSGFTLTPRYTARIDLSEIADVDELHANMARMKRRDIGRWSAQPPEVVQGVPAERVVALHDEALQRSGGAGGDARRESLERLLGLAGSGSGCVLGLIPATSSRIEAVIVLLDGPEESNDVLCVASGEWREAGLTAWATWLGIRRAHSLGKRWFDFNGANSPDRALDKHFYGAGTELYFNGSFGPRFAGATTSEGAGE